MRILVTGGAGFIGSAVCRHLIHGTDADLVNVDKLTYAGNLNSLKAIEGDPRYRFIRADICDGTTISRQDAKTPREEGRYGIEAVTSRQLPKSLLRAPLRSRRKMFNTVLGPSLASLRLGVRFYAYRSDR